MKYEIKTIFFVLTFCLLFIDIRKSTSMVNSWLLKEPLWGAAEVLVRFVAFTNSFAMALHQQLKERTMQNSLSQKWHPEWDGLRHSFTALAVQEGPEPQLDIPGVSGATSGNSEEPQMPSPPSLPFLV